MMAPFKSDKTDNPKGASSQSTVIPILFAISVSHLINDSLQSLIPASYPIIKESFQLNFAQIGLVTFVNQITASLLQPIVGAFTDRHHLPFSLAIGMCFTLMGLAFLSFAQSYGMLLFSVSLIGVGSSVFHPESSRVAHMAAGPRRGFAQSFFQVGGNAGSSLGPLLAALVIAEKGRSRVLFFIPLAVIGIVLLIQVGRWYAGNAHRIHPPVAANVTEKNPRLSHSAVLFAVAILLVLIFSKYFYLASINSYFTFYLIQKFGLSIRSAQIHLFLFQFAVAAGTLIGGPVGDRIGRKYVIWVSILGVAPLTLLLPHVGLIGTTVLSVFIGVILASAFSAILVYAQELIPGKVGLIAGLFFGFAFGMGALGSAALGKLADLTSLTYVYRLTAFLPLLGVIAGLLPNIERARAAAHEDGSEL
jgi:FSR family fosmidomycin resistance protein-like MFS transporter